MLASARRAVGRCGRSTTSAAWSPSCSPTWSGFTSLSERLDPERVKNLVDRCFDRLAEDITSFGGQVDKIVGDALVALFGATTAHEDDPERAVRAALRMQATLCEEAEAIGQELQIRVGINTGEVLVGAMRAAGSVTAMGDVVNTASRLQTHAKPGEVLVGPATYAATHHTIAYESRGLLDAKGRDELVETWVAVSPDAAAGLPGPPRRRAADRPGAPRSACSPRAIDSSIRHDRALLALLVGRRRHGQEPAGRRGRRGRRRDPRRHRPRGPVRPLRRGQRVVAGRRCPAHRARGRRRRQPRPRPATAVRAAVADTMEPRTTDPEVQRTAEGLLTLLGYEPPRRAPTRSPSARRPGAPSVPTLGASARRRPLVLQISDLHWADDAVLTLIDEVFGAIHHCPVVDRWPPPARRCSTSGRPRTAATTPSRCTSTRSAARRPASCSSTWSARPVPDVGARRPARAQRRQPVLPRGAGEPARRRRRWPSRAASPPCPTRCAAWWPPGSTTCRPTCASVLQDASVIAPPSANGPRAAGRGGPPRRRPP